MTEYDAGELRDGIVVPWNVARERRVLESALRLRGRRARRRHALGWAMATAAVVVLFLSVRPPAGATIDESRAPAAKPPNGSSLSSPNFSADGGGMRG